MGWGDPGRVPVEHGRLTGMCWEGLGTPQESGFVTVLRRSLDPCLPERWERRMDSAVA